MGSEQALGPLTYKIYGTDSAPSLRSGSVGAFNDDSSVSTRPRQRLSLGAYVCLVLVGVCVVIATAGAVLLGTADEPRATAAMSPTNAAALAPPPALDAPLQAAASAAASVTAAPQAAPAPPKVARSALGAKAAKTPKPKARPPVRGPVRRGMAVPPNPFGG